MTETAPATHYEFTIHDKEFYASEFDRHRFVSAPDFWRRYGGVPDVRGKRVFDFGSGAGGMLHLLMEAGAASAVGVDLDVGASDYARERLSQEWGADKIEIYCQDLREVEFAPADLVVSQNTMEHVWPLKETLDAVVDKATPGGDIYIGYAPLWYSPFGHHQHPKTSIPWLHLLRGDQLVLDAMEQDLDIRYKTVKEAGFNCCTPADFRAAFAAQPADIVELRRNPGSGGWKTIVSQMLLLPGVVPPLEKYCTTGMYWHLRRHQAAKAAAA